MLRPILWFIGDVIACAFVALLVVALAILLLVFAALRNLEDAFIWATERLGGGR